MCDFIISRGTRKGELCGKKTVKESTRSTRCRLHPLDPCCEKEGCQFVLTRGIRKNQTCNKKIKSDKFCYAHSKTLDFNKCEIQIKRGSRKGEQCGRRCKGMETVCSTHKKIVKNPKDTIKKKTPLLNTVEEKENETLQTIRLDEPWLTNEAPSIDVTSINIYCEGKIKLQTNIPISLKSSIKEKRLVTDTVYVSFENDSFFIVSDNGFLETEDILFAFYYVYCKCQSNRKTVKITEIYFDKTNSVIKDNGSIWKERKM